MLECFEMGECMKKSFLFKKAVFRAVAVAVVGCLAG
jgi:hypothetical protein